MVFFKIIPITVQVACKNKIKQHPHNKQTTPTSENKIPRNQKKIAIC
jgi:hypothetical protein